AVEDARRVADHLDIPYYVLNFKDVFRRHVMANFAAEYARGRTPNPCVRCNQFVKFDALLARAGALGADYVATGHYARIDRRPAPLVDLAGRVLGQHEGVAYYTIGQRKGLGIAAGQPLYVIDILADENRVVVGPQEALLAAGCLVEGVNYVALAAVDGPLAAH